MEFILTREQGRVIRARTGFYDVQHDDIILRCTLRGTLKRRHRSKTGRRRYADPVAVGDWVIFTQLDMEEGVIGGYSASSDKVLAAIRWKTRGH